MREVGRNVELVDPQRIAEDIISMRSEAAMEEIVTTIPEEHTLRKVPSAYQAHGMIHNQRRKSRGSG
jgi:hypothetical protein